MADHAVLISPQHFDLILAGTGLEEALIAGWEGVSVTLL